MAKKVLIVCTSHDKLGSSGQSTGSWVEEVAAPWYVWKNHGFEVTVASIKGGVVPFDEASLSPPFLTKEAAEFLQDDAAKKAVTESVPVTDVRSADFDAIFLPGGHGTSYDLPDNEPLRALLEEFAAAGKVVAAVCHGPVGLVSAKGPDGKPLVAGKKVTGFSDDEEVAVGKDKYVPFMLEARLKELGGVYSKAAEMWAVYAVRDGKLVTGQNPGSSARTAELVVEALAS